MQTHYPSPSLTEGSCPPAMVYGVDQRIGQIYEPVQAIRSGTLFPDLYKPMLEQASAMSCSNVDSKQALDFSAWEMRLYLDTHPNDTQALTLYRRFCEAMSTPGYACAFVTQEQGGKECCQGRPSTLTRWRWLDDPWPWEIGTCCQTEEKSHVCV